MKPVLDLATPDLASPAVNRSLVLSLFPGIDLLGRAFEDEGFCIVRGPDLLWGGDIRRFSPPRAVFGGIVGGSPCQQFSSLYRLEPDGTGAEMVHQFERVTAEAEPEWFLLENVPGVPDIAVPGYKVQRFNLRASECGARQHRLRTFQFGSRDGKALVLERGAPIADAEPAALASEANREGRRNFPEFCELQGLPADFLKDSPLTFSGKYRVVGNGVPIPMGRVIARAVLRWFDAPRLQRVCVCGCGRPVRAGVTLATAACRKREQRRRDAAPVTGTSSVTAGASLFPVTDRSRPEPGPSRFGIVPPV